MPYVLAIDQGTSSSRAVVFDGDGREVAAAQRPVEAVFPADGWVEQDPEALWDSVLAVAREAIAASGLAPRQIEAIGIVNQRETTLAWDAHTGAAFGNAIVWQDRRTAEQCQRIRDDGVEPEIAAITGLLVDPYFSSTKLKWMLDQADLESAAARGDVRFGTVDSFLVWRLTKGSRHVTDATNAARTQLFDIGQQAWSDRLLDYFGIAPAVLPTVLDCFDDFGVADAEWFGAPIPIRGVAGDQQAALLGQGCLEPGMVKSTYGTGCFVIANTGPERVRSSQRLLTTVGYRVGGIDNLCVGRQHLQRRRRHQVAARHARPDRVRGRHRARCTPDRGRNGRRVRRPGIHRSRRSPLATGCQGSDHRPDAGLEPRPDRHGHAEGHRVSNGGSARGGRCRRCGRDRVARRWRHGRQRLVLPVPGRRRGHGGRCAPGEHRDDGAWARGSWRRWVRGCTATSGLPAARGLPRHPRKAHRPQKAFPRVGSHRQSMPSGGRNGCATGGKPWRGPYKGRAP